MDENEPLNFSVDEVYQRILNHTTGLCSFWSSPNGWAPIESANLLSKAQLEWHISLTRSLKILLENKKLKEDGILILAWTTLGSLVETNLKLFLSVWYKDYKASVNKTALKGYKKKNKIVNPDQLMLEKLKNFFAAEVYPQTVRDMWKQQGRLDLIEWIDKVQKRRNSIHAFKKRDIGDFDDFEYELKRYLIFVRRITDTFPYPDSIYEPREI